MIRRQRYHVYLEERDGTLLDLGEHLTGPEADDAIRKAGGGYATLEVVEEEFTGEGWVPVHAATERRWLRGVVASENRFDEMFPGRREDIFAGRRVEFMGEEERERWNRAVGR